MIPIDRGEGGTTLYYLVNTPVVAGRIKEHRVTLAHPPP
jgi:hypothetical protein